MTPRPQLPRHCKSRRVVSLCSIARDADPSRPSRVCIRSSFVLSVSYQVTPIVGNKSIEPSSLSPSRATRSSKDQLSFEAYLPGTVAAMSFQDLEAHLHVVYNVLDDPSAPVRRRGQTLLYLQSLAPITQVSNLMLNTAFLVLLLR